MLGRIAGLLQRNGHVLGVDVGYQNCKVALVRQGREGVRVEKLASTPVPAGTWKGDRLADPVALGDALAALLRAEGVTCRKAVAAIPIRAAHLRRFSLPAMPARDLTAAVRWEMQRFLSVPVEEAALDYLVLRKAAEAGAGSAEILAAAAPAEVTRAYGVALRRAGLRPLAVEVEPLALWRLARHLHRTTPWSDPLDGGRDQAEVLLDIGAYRSSLLIYSDDDLLLARPIPIGGNAFTEALARARSLTLPEAESLKLGARERLLEETDAAFRELVAELNRTFRHFLQTHARARLARMLLSGGGAAVRGLGAALSAALEVPVENLDPTPLVEGDTALAAEDRDRWRLRQFSVALGLALRPAARPLPRPGAERGFIDLSAPRLRSAEDRRQRLRTGALTALVALDLVALGALAVGTAGGVGARARLAALRATGIHPETVFASQASMESALREDDARLQLLAPLRRRPDPPRLTALVAGLVPPGVAVSQLSAGGTALRLAGTASDVAGLAGYLESLQARPEFGRVQLEETAPAGDGRLRFVISLERGGNGRPDRE